MTEEQHTPQPSDRQDADGADHGAAAPDATDATAPDATGGADHDAPRGFAPDAFTTAFAEMTDGPEAVDAAAPPQYGVGPFSVREVALGAIWLVAFIVSFFPIYAIGPGGSVWTSGIDWLLPVGVPTVAVFLLALRRLSPQGIRRIGSLGIDQFASVAFSVAAIVWLGILWASFVSFAGQSVFYATWVVWVEFVLMVAGVVLTVFAPLLPTVGDDFRHRTQVSAHRFASPARPVIARPRPERTLPADSSAHAPVAHAAGRSAADHAGDRPGPDRPDSDHRDAGHRGENDAAAAPAEHAQGRTTQSVAPASQAFWALAPVERDVVDETGAPMFTIGPTAWALVIEDRGDRFVVRHEDGRIGYLTDVSGVTRG